MRVNSAVRSARILAPVFFAFVLFLSASSSLRAQEPAGETTKGVEAAHEGGKEAEEKPEPSQTLKWANFAILAVAIGVFLAKSLPKDFAERTAAIQKDIKEAQKVKADAEARAAQVEARLKSLGADIETFRTQAAADMKHEGDRIRQDTAAQIERLQTQSALEIESAGKTARRELKQYSAELALQLAEQRIRTRLDADTEAALIDGFVADLGLVKQATEGSKN